MHLSGRRRILFVVVIVTLVACNFSLVTDVWKSMAQGNIGSRGPGPGPALSVVDTISPPTTLVTDTASIPTLTTNSTAASEHGQPFNNSIDADNAHHTNLDEDITTNNRTTQAPTSFAENNNTSKTISTLSACLLIKDENDALNEWVAYHYHLWNLRHLVVAVDPSSQTSPRPLLDQWHNAFQLDYVLWDDADYMPTEFLKGDYSKFKIRLGKVREKFPNRNFTAEELQQISNHNNRQREFLRKCYGHFDKHPAAAGKAPAEWIAHIDVDEYLSWNPLLLLGESKLPFTHPSQVPILSLASQQPTAGYMMQIFQDHYQYDSAPCCVLIPRLLFGGVEQETNRTVLSPPWNTTSFNSIRWRYHAPFHDGGPLNGPPKALVNWKVIRARLRHQKGILQGVYSIHRPSKYVCPKSVSFNASFSFETEISWFAIRHFLGSLERYLARQDARRSIEVRDNNPLEDASV